MKRNSLNLWLVSALMLLALPACQLDEIYLDCPVVTGVSMPRAKAGETVVVSVDNLRLNDPGSYRLKVGGRAIPVQSVDIENQRVVFVVPEEGMPSGEVLLSLASFSCNADTINFDQLPIVEYVPAVNQVQSNVFVEGVFNLPSGLAVDTVSGDLFVADENNHRVWKVSPERNIREYAGQGNEGCMENQDSRGLAQFTNPGWVVYEHSSQTLYLTDNGCNGLFQIGTGAIKIAGGGTIDNGCPSNLAARFSQPQGVAVSADRQIFIVDYTAKSIKRVADGQTCTIISNVEGFDPFALVYDDTHRVLYCSDFTPFGDLSGAVYEVDPDDGSVAPLTFSEGSSTLTAPSGLALDHEGNLFIADGVRKRVLKYYRRSGFLEELALPFNDELFQPRGLAYDSKRKRLYLSDRQLNKIYVIHLK